MASGQTERRSLPAIPLWAWPLYAIGALVCFSLVHLLFYTSDGVTRIVVVNDTSARLHVFECFNDACTKGVNDDGAILAAGETSKVLGSSSLGTGLVGEATTPSKRLIGCIYVRHAAQTLPLTHAASASSVTPCPGQKPGTTPVVEMVNP